MSVGTITIPTMIRAGYRRDFASYASVAIAAAIPAILYFSAIYFSIDCYARANDLNPMPRDDIPRAHDVFLSMGALPAFGPLLLLAWMFFSGYTPTLAGGAATLVMVASPCCAGWFCACSRAALATSVENASNWATRSGRGSSTAARASS
jgi:TRAP-type uncharacterized transport system fused permease subunit